MKENEILFLDRTIKHIRRVQDNLILLEKNRDKLPFEIEKWFLMNCLDHDLTKFRPSIVEDYVATNEYFRNKKLGLSVEHIDYKKLQKAWKIHEMENGHHPEYKKEMSDIDLCEMCCDISAMSQEFNEKDYTKYFTEKLIKDVPMLEKYEKDCIKILKLLQELNN